jgi:hypothetical protein
MKIEICGIFENKTGWRFHHKNHIISYLWSSAILFLVNPVFTCVNDPTVEKSAEDV